jgi:adenine deaminase
LLPFINQFNDQASFFATDDRHPNDLLDDGHIDQMIRRTIEYSGNIIRAIRMATINGCQHFGLTHLGQISPGKQADIVVIKDFHELKISHVIKKGKTVVFNGEVIAQAANKSNPELHHTVKLTDFSIDRLKIKATDGSHQLRVIGIVPEQIITEPFTETFHGENGEIRADLSRDLLKLAVIERHGKNGNIGLAFVKGLGITGAIAATVAHDSHNLIVAGSNDAQMARAVYLLEQSGGGLAIVTEKEEEVLPLPVAGLMSEDSLENVSAGISRLNDLAKNAGTTLTDPFMTLSFLALPVIPTLKLTDQGIVDVNQFRHVSLFCE